MVRKLTRAKLSDYTPRSEERVALQVEDPRPFDLGTAPVFFEGMAISRPNPKTPVVCRKEGDVQFTRLYKNGKTWVAARKPRHLSGDGVKCFLDRECSAGDGLRITKINGDGTVNAEVVRG